MTPGLRTIHYSLPNETAKILPVFTNMKKHRFDALPTMTRAERVAELHGMDSLFLPSDVLQSTVVPTILWCALALCVVFSATFLVVDALLPEGAATPRAKRRKVCYQLTNFCANTALGFAGLYTELYLQPPDLSYTNIPPEHSVQDFDHLLFFSCFQLGYQLWAIPTGGILVGESPAMLAHHFAVILVAGMSAFMTNGFRYWTPFFYGFIELSSIPLAIMNTFKDNPAWIQKHSRAYLAVRLIFCFMFLWIRLVMFLPRQYVFLRDHFLLFISSDNRPYQVFMSLVFVSALILQILQVYWGFLILKGLARVVQGFLFGSKKKKESSRASSMNGVGKENGPSNGTQTKKES